jgi:CBS domain containing-hemolysin-like protein
MHALLVVLFGGLALMSVGLLKSYRHVPEREMRRRAREGDELAEALYKVAAYGHSMGAVLWALVVFMSALFFVTLANEAPAWFAVTASAALLWVAFVWLPARDVTRFSTWLAVQLVPVLAWVLNYLHPVLNWVARFVEKHRHLQVHTGMYDREDLVRLLLDQKVQPGNRIDQVELDVALHALTFGEALVRDAMMPRRVVKMVSASETIGPVLMDELHGSGFSRFPVYSGKKDNVVGMLYMRDLVHAKAGGSIEKVMHDDIAYIHEEQPLTDALQAILKTRKHLFIVVNSFEEYVGIISMEDVLERIVGRAIFDEFDQYDDLRAVAARAAKKEHKEHVASEKAAEQPVTELPLQQAPESKPESTTEEPPEVVK